jgi:hypothetical protein
MANSTVDATNDIVFTDVMFSRYNFTKRLDATFTAGNNGGGLDTGAIADGWYHCHAIRKGSAIDYIFSTSLTAPTIPTGWSLQFRRIGSILRVSGVLKPFFQVGSYFIWKTVAQDLLVTTQGATAILRTISTPPGMRVVAILNAGVAHATATSGTVYFSSPDATDEDPANNYAVTNVCQVNARGVYGRLLVLTDTSSQVRTRGIAASTTVVIGTVGWEETEDRQAA